MFRLDHNLLLSIARRLDVNHDLQSLSETSKVLHALASQGVLPGPVELRGPGDGCSVDQLQQILLRAKQMHRVPALTISSVPYLPHDFLGRATIMTSLTVTKCTLEHLPQLPPQLTSLVFEYITLRQIAPDTFFNLTGLVELKLTTISGLTELPALPPNLSDLQLSSLSDRTSQLPQLPPALYALAVYDCAELLDVPRQLPPSLALFTWQAGSIDLAPSLEPFTHLEYFELDTFVGGYIDGIEDLSPLQSNLKEFAVTGAFNLTDSISSLTGLTSLQIKLDLDSPIPPVIDHLHLLEELELQPAPPLGTFNNLTRLTELKLQYGSAVAIHPSISRLAALKDFSVSWYAYRPVAEQEPAAVAAAAANVSPLPPILQYLTSLKHLKLDLITVPQCWTLPSLPSSVTYLRTYNCQLPTQTNLRRLRCLSLWFKEEETLAAALSLSAQQFCSSLQSLEILSARFAVLPASVFDLTRLTSLSLSEGSEDLVHIFPALCRPMGSISGVATRTACWNSTARAGIMLRTMPRLTSLKVHGCLSCRGVAETPELAAEILPNLRQLSQCQ